MAKIITIDGYSSCGKTSIAQELANKFDIPHIDSGLLFRFISYLISNKELSITGLAAFNYFDFFQLNGTVLYDSLKNPLTLKTEEIGLLASNLGSDPKIQEKIIDIQRNAVKYLIDELKVRGIVLSGRNCGTAVMPNADIKYFLTAPLNVRVDRRYDQLISLKLNASKDNILLQIQKRDNKDSNREFGKMQKPDDAVVIDTSKYTKDELLQYITRHLKSTLF